MAFYAYFFDIVKRSKGDNAGENFIAITDPGTMLEARAKRDTFRRIFLNPSDIGGRYSVLSYFGMVPAALMGLNVTALLDRADVAVKACRPENPIRENPGAVLGAALSTLARRGRDKMTLITPPPLQALGLWIEHLIAESTSKEGRGIVPVTGEPLGRPEVFGDDRVFVRLRTPDQPVFEDCPELKALVDAGHPLIDLVLAQPLDLGAEFFRWEVAAALAGQRLGVNPFDQPNVQESKDHTKALLNQYKEQGKLPELAVVATFEALTLRTDLGNRESILRGAGSGSGRDAFVSCLKAHLRGSSRATTSP